MNAKVTVRTIQDNAHIFQCLDVSTAHITERDNELLAKDGISISVYPYEYGWLVYSGDGQASKADFERALKEGFSQALINLICIAHEKGCKFLNLDCDGMLYDDLPTFDW